MIKCNPVTLNNKSIFGINLKYRNNICQSVNCRSTIWECRVCLENGELSELQNIETRTELRDSTVEYTSGNSIRIMLLNFTTTVLL